MKSWVCTIRKVLKTQLLSLLVTLTFIFLNYPPVIVNAGVFSTAKDLIISLFNGDSGNSGVLIQGSSNPNQIPLLQNTTNFNTNAAIGGDDLVFSNNEALVSESGPSGTFADISDSGKTGQISKYIVKKEDTLSGIAKMFGVSKNTIIWANDLTGERLKEGQVLVILPVSGTIHTVKSGDNLSIIAKKYKANVDEIADFNNLSLNSKLTVGQEIIIPDGDGSANASISSSKSTYKINIVEKVEYDGYYMRPVIGGIKTQGIHGWNGIDIGVNVGTPVYAAAGGEVIIARNSGYNGGYGKYVVVSHYNGTQTVYGHLSEVLVNPGEKVGQGQPIALSGNTGRSTGPHLHFEIRGAKNPF